MSEHLQRVYTMYQTFLRRARGMLPFECVQSETKTDVDKAGVWQADQLRRQGFSIHDLFQRGYARTDEDWESSQGSSPVVQARVEMKDAVHPGNHDGHEENDSSDVQALPIFVGGRWQGNI